MPSSLPPSIAVRRQAARQALAIHALSDLEPSALGSEVLAQWVDGHWTCDEAVDLVVQHYCAHPCSDSDHAAQENLLGLTDSRQLQQAEADITILRLARQHADLA